MYDILQSLSGANSVVVGGARGMGSAIARGLRQAGARVAVVDVLPPEAAGDERYVQADITSRGSVAAAFERVDRWFDTVEVVINTAGITGAAVPAEEIDPDEWTRVVGVNLSGRFWVCQQAAIRMLPRGRGSIVNVSSMGAYRVVRDAQHAYYNASKAGLISLSQALANEWGPRGVRVNVIAPGAHITDMMRQLYEHDETRLNAHLEHARMAAPLRRVADADDIVPTALFLAAESASYITGDVIRHDGGRGLSFD